MEGITLNTICSVCKGKLLCCEDGTKIEPRFACIDSRKIALGDVFFALPGDNTDGHKYVNTAFEGGASCAVVSSIPDEGYLGPVVLVESVLTALQDLAAFYRGELKASVIGVTGSVGKTTTKEMIAAVLSHKLQVCKTEGNLNNEIGVPLTLLSASRRDEAVVVEMGISDFGEMTLLSKIAKPNYMVYTAIGAAHLDNLGDLSGVFRAKTEAIGQMPDNGIVIYNGDDAYLRTIECQQKRVIYGTQLSFDLVATDVGQTKNGSNFIIHHGESVIATSCSTPGRHMVYAALAGAAVGLELGLTGDEISEGIQAYATVGHRSRIIETGRYTIIDDCYNANPTSMEVALRALAERQGEKVCVLGDMLELGKETEQYHERIGKIATECGLRCVLAVGEQAEAICRGTGEIGVPFRTKQELIQHLNDYLRDGDTVLVKASRGLALEEVVEVIEQF